MHITTVHLFFSGAGIEKTQFLVYFLAVLERREMEKKAPSFHLSRPFKKVFRLPKERGRKVSSPLPALFIFREEKWKFFRTLFSRLFYCKKITEKKIRLPALSFN